MGLTLGQEVARIRETRGMSKAALSRATGLNIHTIYRIEDDKIQGSPTYITMALISEALNVDMLHWKNFISGNEQGSSNKR